ncbi:hypothetical protein QAD02_009332 [Eretmocerus hayati]|uniref:Uncharacterized protein n=1 Tax=Eretmocerus hayati TaxID=131215 RepID=A0ACC2NBG0_9HYME|nr:hypothetical protein QAD02_009332 [Eretmocerus hayati]
MFITCKCLNVSIKTKTSDLNTMNIDDIDLTKEEKADIFFKSDLATTKQLENITKEQPGLVETRIIGAWVVHRCYNCMTYTHAVHREFGAAMVLIRCNLITSEEEIINLKASPGYSSVFRIVISHSKIDQLDMFEPPPKLSVCQLPSNLRLALGGLEQQLNEAIQRQALLTAERIKSFTEEQYQILETFKERAHNEHSFLAKLICTEHQNLSGSANLETPPATPETNQPNKSTSESDVVDATIINNQRNLPYKKPLPKPVKGVHPVNGTSDNNHLQKEPVSSDGETLFLLEGMDEPLLHGKPFQVSDLESDSEDSGSERVNMARIQKNKHSVIAKSLPVTVPAFHSFGRRPVRDEDDEEISENPMDPHNIQASIRALAKSVHGDTVFGDLPRPRFSTQI